VAERPQPQPEKQVETQPAEKAEVPDLLDTIKSLQTRGPRELVSTSALRDKLPGMSKEEFDNAIFKLSKKARCPP